MKTKGCGGEGRGAPQLLAFAAHLGSDGWGAAASPPRLPVGPAAGRAEERLPAAPGGAPAVRAEERLPPALTLGRRSRARRSGPELAGSDSPASGSYPQLRVGSRPGPSRAAHRPVPAAAAACPRPGPDP